MKVKRIGNHTLPVPARATPDAAGLDLRNAGPRVVVPCAWGGRFKSGKFVYDPDRRDVVNIPTGFAVEIPTGYEGAVRGRSGLASRYGVIVLQTGTIDADYRGGVRVLLINHGFTDVIIDHGDRIAQLVVSPVALVDCEESDELTETQRGAAGFGSTGRT